MDAQRRKVAVAALSVASNTTLVALKVVVGLLIGSVSVISEAIHSGVDLLAAVIALFAVRTASKPADEGHPFGHGKVENVSGTVEAILIFLAAGWIIYEAIHKLFAETPLDEPGYGVLVMLFSSVVNLVVSQKLFKVGKETDSVALQADAWHLRTDVYTSAGVMVGLGAIWIGSRVWPSASLAWIDPVSAIAVALLIIKAAWDLTRESARDLLDVRLPPEEEQWVRSCVSRQRPRVRGFHELRTRKAGSDRFIDLHLIVDGTMSVDASHQVTDDIERAVKEKLQGVSVSIHVEPCTDDCEPECIDGCFLSDEERAELKPAASRE
jgi:cation diffusion facilitator family transporter